MKQPERSSEGGPITDSSRAIELRRNLWSQAAAVAARTPESRSRYVDFLRALSILAVISGHGLSQPWWMTRCSSPPTSREWGGSTTDSFGWPYTNSVTPGVMDRLRDRGEHFPGLSVALRC